MKKFLSAVLALCTLFAVANPLNAQSTTYNTSSVNVNVGRPALAIFYFDQIPGTVVNATVLTVACDQNRATLTKHFDVYGQQEQATFAVGCTGTVSKNSLGQYVDGFSVNGTPLTEELTLTNAYGATEEVNLTVYSASWKSTEKGGGRSGSPGWYDGHGTASISY